MRYWSQILHFYQPPTQDLGVTRSILIFCYLPLLRMLVSKSGYGITVNLSGSLLLQLKQIPEASEFFNLIDKLLRGQKIELLNSAIYHPIIPLTPPDVINRQISENQRLLTELFSIDPLNGFYYPECAIDMATLDTVDFQYTIVDQSAADNTPSIVKYKNKILLVNNHPVCDLLRSYPQELKASEVIDLIKNYCDDNQLIVVGSDAELFGHHYVERLQVLSDLLDDRTTKFITASQAVFQFSSQTSEITTIKPSTWQNCQQFALWNKHDLQKEYLRLLDLAHSLSNSDLLDQSYSSCYLYWLSNWPWWHPGFVEKGVENITNSAKENNAVKIAAQLFLDNMWKYHHSGQVEKNYQEYNQSSDKFLRI